MHPEIQHYLAMIEDLHSQVRALIADLSADALNWRPLPTNDDHATNSLAVLAAHVAGAEEFWVIEVVGGQPVGRERSAEFGTAVEDNSELLARLDQVGHDVRQVLTTLSVEELETTPEVQGKTVTVRWALLHVIEHTALHLGHMQITYQLWQGGRAGPSPRWYERVRKSLNQETGKPGNR